MKIGIHISELLFEHDAVILSGFGEFYTRYNPAKFVPEEGRIEAPSKTIAFNPENKQGTTPLVAYLCERQNMKEDQVSKYLSDFVSEISALLEEGKKVELEKIGIFSKNQDGSLNFEPDLSVNYLDETIGLGAVEEPPKKSASQLLVTDQPGEVPISEVVSAKESESVEANTDETNHKHEEYIMEQEKRQSLPPALRWIAFTVVPILVVIIILALNYNYFFSCSRQQKQTETTVIAPVETPSEDDAMTQPSGAEAPAEEARPAPQQQTVTDPGVQPPKPEPGRKVYFIVVGSFPEEATAEQLALNLRKQGASLASVFMKTGFNYHRVCYGYYYDLKEAEAILDAVKENVNPDAYILHR
jgi:nucleoid DNA-binding protein